MNSRFFALSLLSFCILPCLCELPNFYRDFDLLQRDKKPSGYRYKLDNECYPALRTQLITVPPEQQELLFEFIALNISDIRMFPSDCRRSAVWLLCSLAFPSVHQDPSDTQDVCLVGEEECEYVSELCEGELDCSELEDYYPKNDDGGLCPRLEESVSIPVEVQTCLKSDTETTDCCFDPYVKADGTKECVVECPAGIWDNDAVEIVSYVIFGFAWLSVFVLIVGLFPLCFMKGALRYPKPLVPAGFITVVLWTLTKMWGVFVGVDEWICDGSEDGVAASIAFFDSSRCAAQFFFLNYFSSLAAVEMVAVAAMFLILVTDPNSKLIFTLKPLFYFGLFFLPLAAAATLTLLVEFRDYDDTLIIFPSVGNSCQLNLSEDIGVVLVVFYTVLFCTTYILGAIAAVKVFLRSWQLLRVHIKPVLFLVLMTYITTLLLVVFYKILPEGTDAFTEYEEGLYCVAFHARDVDYPCKYEYMDDFAYFSFVEISIAACPTVGGIALFWNTVIFSWWMDVLVHCRLGRSAQTTRGLTNQSSFISGSAEVDEDRPPRTEMRKMPDRMGSSSRLMRLQQERSSARGGQSSFVEVEEGPRSERKMPDRIGSSSRLMKLQQERNSQKK